MINHINYFTYNAINYKNPDYRKAQNYKLHAPLKFDSVSFSGKSLPSEYVNVFDYLAAEVLGSRGKQYQVNGSLLSASKIKAAVQNLFSNNIYSNYKKSDYTQIKWKDYIPLDVRVFSIDKINMARKSRLSQWKNVLENSSKPITRYDKLLQEKLHRNPSMKFVIWDSITSELKSDNRHIPVPYDAKALFETIERYEAIAPKDRAVSCAKPSFVEYYTHRLRDNLLMKMGLSNNDSVWVKIPSISHDRANAEENISKLEILSNKNWCTRSSVDKAVDALTDGDFHIFLRRNKTTKIWEPSVGMTSLRGKIDQIQGKDNDNIVPMSFLSEIKSYIEKQGLKCHTGVVDEGPKATNAIMISEKLKEKNVTKQTFAVAIEENDCPSMFEFLDISVKKLPNRKMVISSYRPVYCLDKNKGLTVPYSMFGLNEDSLLRNVEKIEGNFVLSNKNQIYNSRITMFPPSLKSVTGKIICNAEQFEKYKEDMLRVVDGNLSKIVISHSK